MTEKKGKSKVFKDVLLIPKIAKVEKDIITMGNPKKLCALCVSFSPTHFIAFNDSYRIYHICPECFTRISDPIRRKMEAPKLCGTVLKLKKEALM